MTELFLRRGHRVAVLDDFRYRQGSLLHLCHSRRLEIVKGDVRDRRRLAPLLAESDVIIPLAAVVGAPACEARPEESRSVNVGAIRLLDRLRSKNQAVLFPVTNSGYGVGEEGVYRTETSPLRPVSRYGRQKVEAEKILLAGGGAVAFRLATAFGVSPRMRLDLLVNDFTYRAVKEGVIVLFEEHFQRNYIHVRDVARVFYFGMKNYSRLKGEVFNVGLSNANLSKIELCRRIKKFVPKLAIITSKVGRDPDRRNYLVSNAKIEKAGFRPIFSLDAGIQELIRAYSFVKNSVYDNL
jgi:nucleoside-diphosphate-sugar epimerase